MPVAASLLVLTLLGYTLVEKGLSDYNQDQQNGAAFDLYHLREQQQQHQQYAESNSIPQQTVGGREIFMSNIANDQLGNARPQGSEYSQQQEGNGAAYQGDNYPPSNQLRVPIPNENGNTNQEHFVITNNDQEDSQSATSQSGDTRTANIADYDEQHQAFPTVIVEEDDHREGERRWKFRHRNSYHHGNFEDHDHDNEGVIVGHCNINEPCKKGEYCDYNNCYRCRKHGDHCEATGQCCKGTECQYGICEKGIYAGEPGTFCDRRSDCKGADTCCILEHSISEHTAVCKPMLNEHEMCGPLNLFQQTTHGKANEQSICGPCREGLTCQSISHHGRLSICLPEEDA